VTLLKKKWGSFRYQMIIYLFNWIAVYLPVSYRPGGSLGRAFRHFLAKRLFLSCGQGANIERGAFIEQPWSLQIGEGSGIGVNSYIDGPVKIGNQVMMGPQVTIYRRNHTMAKLDIPMIEQGFDSFVPLDIEADVWIGGHVIILPSVKKIGKGSVLAAGAVVVKDVLPFEIIGGNPGRKINSRINSEKRV